MNGHVTNGSTLRTPENNQKHCEHCAKPTITKCLNCNEPIRGHPYSQYLNWLNSIPAPSFCIACGKPSFPWFETKVQAAKELADMLEDLDDKDKESVKASFDDLIQDNPRSEVAAAKIKQQLKKLKQGAKDQLYKAAVDIASETAKKILLSGME
jgi:hypothetical protein